MNNIFSKLALMLVAGGLFIMSVYSEIMLFTSTADSALTQFLATIFAFCLVLAQMVFADQASYWFGRNNPLLGGICSFAVLLLMVVSIAGTIFFFEGMYERDREEKQTSSTGYRLTEELIKNKNETILGLKSSAKNSEEKGNAWDAGQKLIAASEVEKELHILIHSLKEHKNFAGNGSSVMANKFSELRWSAWAIFAFFADFLPILAVVCLRYRSNETVIQNETKPMNEMKLENETKSVNEMTIENEQEFIDSIKTMILKHKIVPPISEVKSMGFKYSKFRVVIGLLLDEGFIKKRGRGWELA